MGAVTVNPVQTDTYVLDADNNPITFGPETNIDVSSAGDGIDGSGAAVWSVTNIGTISATGADSTGVEIDDGTVTNQSGGKISGDGSGIADVFGTATVTNSGVISGTGTVSEGIELYRAGTVHNLSGGTISGGTVSVSGGTVHINGDGILIANNSGNGLVTNAGAISGGVSLISGTVDNYSGGTISGFDAVGIDGGLSGLTAVVINAGSIIGSSDHEGVGVAVGDLSLSDTVDNETDGTISAGGVGVEAGSAGSVTNAGAITGGVASVEFSGGGANTLTLQTGSKLTGDAIGSTVSGATNTLVLQGSGEADNNFDHFSTLNVQASGDWTLGGDSTIGAATVTSGNLIVTGDLEVTENLMGSVIIGHGGTLKLEAGPAAGSSIDFQGAGTLILAQTYGGTVAGFGASDLIDLTNLHYDSSASHYSVSSGSGPNDYEVTVFEGANSLSLQFEQSTPVTESDFTLTQDASGDTEILSGSSGTPPPPTADILFQSVDGQAAIWDLSGTNVVGGGPVNPNPGPSWKTIGTGDFFGGGPSDLLWQSSSGQLSIWEMSGTSLVGGGDVSPNPGSAWQAIGTGDFNDDGHSDILLQNADGEAAIWEMNGTKVIGGGAVSPNPGPSWKAIGTGDFNDDGHSDILWQNADGQIAIWDMNGSALIGGGTVSPNPGPAWQAIGTGHFYGAGDSDILLQNASSGQVAIWEMNGTKIIGGGTVSVDPGPSWHAVGTSGGSDILLQSTSGQTAIWDMNGTSIIGGGTVSANAGPTWRAVQLS